tara:strand:+ start:768 stop:1688 length:921 start_codon:yes stop_codon:yes gene_type:complete
MPFAIFFRYPFIRRSVLEMAIAILLCFPSLVYSQPHNHFDPSTLPPIKKGEFLLSQSLNEEALQIFQSLIEERREGGYAFRGMVRAYKNMNKLDEAEGWIENFLADNPDSSSALYGSGYVHYLKDEIPEAERLFNRALELDANNSLALNNKGAILSRQKSYTSAADMVRGAIRINPKEPMFYRNLETIYKAMGDPGLIIADYNSYQGRGSSELVRGYGMAVGRNLRQAGFRLYEEGRLNDAIAKFMEIETVYKHIRHQEGLVPVYFSLGLLYEEKGEAQNAIKYFNQVLALNPLHLQAKERMDRIK